MDGGEEEKEQEVKEESWGWKAPEVFVQGVRGRGLVAAAKTKSGCPRGELLDLQHTVYTHTPVHIYTYTLCHIVSVCAP